MLRTYIKCVYAIPYAVYSKYLQNSDHGRYFRYFFGRYSVFFGICNTNVGIGIGILKYRGIGTVSVLPTQEFAQ